VAENLTAAPCGGRHAWKPTHAPTHADRRILYSDRHGRMPTTHSDALQAI